MEETLKKIIRVLEKAEGLTAYALIGGLAVGGWVTPRATRDIDILAELSETDRAGSFQDLADASKILTEAEYDRGKLLTLAKRARVDKRLMRLMERLGLDPDTPE